MLKGKSHDGDRSRNNNDINLIFEGYESSEVLAISSKKLEILST